MAKSASDKSDSIQTISRNRRAFHDYHVLEKVECGMVLVGTEVKSLRDGHCKLDEAYAKVEAGELWLIGCEIPEYAQGSYLNHKPKRQRKLLVHRRELNKLAGRITQKGLTLVPLAMYFKNGKAKLELAVAEGKQLHDKRESLKKAEAKREMDRAMSVRRNRR